MLDLRTAFECVSSFKFPKKILRVLCGFFGHQPRAQFEGCVAAPFHTITAIVPGSKWICLLLRSEVKVYPPMQLKMFVDDITASLEWAKRGVGRYCGEGSDGKKDGCGEKRSKAVGPGRRNRGEEQGDCVIESSGREVSGIWQERSGLATSVETPGVDLRTRTKQLGAKGEARRSKGDVRFTITRSKREGETEVPSEVLTRLKESRPSQKLFEDWSTEVAESGFGPCESVERTSLGHHAHRKAEVETTDGSSNKQDRICLAISLHGGE